MKTSKKIVKKYQKIEQVEQKKSVIKDISLQFNDFTEVYERVDLTECISQQSKELQVKKIIKLLEKNYNLSFINKEVKYYLQNGGVWMYCPKFKMSISPYDYNASPQIKLSILACKEYIQAIMEQSESNSQSQANSEQQLEGDLKCRRLKERKIKHVIEKVLKWRELYAGIGSEEKIPLDEGAKLVNISKKTLDDYLSQIKKGKKYGFNFNEHKNQKIGILRQFIRKAEKTKK